MAKQQLFKGKFKTKTEPLSIIKANEDKTN